MRYARAKLEDYGLSRAYRFYVTDTLKMIADNTTRQFGGYAPTMRFCDLQKKPVIETRTSEEIIQGIQEKIKNLGVDT